MRKHLLDQVMQSKIYELYLYAFNAEDSPERRTFWNDRFQHSIPYGIVQEKEIQSALLRIPFKINFFSNLLKMDGICDVMTAPEFSGHGGASTLMKDALTDMYNEGVTLSYLAPFSFTYYRKFGYEQVFDHINYELSSNHLPKINNSIDTRVKRGNWVQDVEKLQDLYQNSHLSQKGGLQRELWWWHYLTKKYPHRQLAIAITNQKLVGYLIYERIGMNFVIHELVASSNESRIALLKFITKHQTTTKKFIYHSASGELNMDFLPDPQYLTTTATPYMMARIINLKYFLETYPTNLIDCDLIFGVKDDVLEGNHGQWHLSISNHKIKIKKINNELPTNKTLTIQQLTKVLFGYQTLAHQWSNGQLPSIDQELIQFIDELAVNEKPILADYF